MVSHGHRPDKGRPHSDPFPSGREAKRHKRDKSRIGREEEVVNIAHIVVGEHEDRQGNCQEQGDFRPTLGHKNPPEPGREEEQKLKGKKAKPDSHPPHRLPRWERQEMPSVKCHVVDKILEALNALPSDLSPGAERKINVKDRPENGKNYGPERPQAVSPKTSCCRQDEGRERRDDNRRVMGQPQPEGEKGKGEPSQVRPKPRLKRTEEDQPEEGNVERIDLGYHRLPPEEMREPEGEGRHSRGLRGRPQSHRGQTQDPHRKPSRKAGEEVPCKSRLPR